MYEKFSGIYLTTHNLFRPDKIPFSRPFPDDDNDDNDDQARDGGTMEIVIEVEKLFSKINAKALPNQPLKINCALVYRVII